MLNESVSAHEAYERFESALYEARIVFEATAPIYHLEWKVSDPEVMLENDTRLIFCQFQDAEYYKLPLLFAGQDEYLRPTALLRISWSESMTEKSNSVLQCLGWIRFKQFLNIARLSDLRTCDLPFLIIQSISPRLSLGHRKAFHYPTRSNQFDSLDLTAQKKLQTLWKCIAEKL